MLKALTNTPPSDGARFRHDQIRLCGTCRNPSWSPVQGLPSTCQCRKLYKDQICFLPHINEPSRMATGQRGNTAENWEYGYQNGMGWDGHLCKTQLWVFTSAILDVIFSILSAKLKYTFTSYAVRASPLSAPNAIYTSLQPVLVVSHRSSSSSQRMYFHYNTKPTHTHQKNLLEMLLDKLEGFKYILPDSLALWACLEHPQMHCSNPGITLLR